MLKCRDVMTKDPICCLASDRVEQIAQIMERENIGSVPVVASHDHKRLIGIVTDRDLALKVLGAGRDSRQTKVEAVLTVSPVTCQPDEDLQQALDRMAQAQVRRLPVVDGDGRIVGIIAQADIATRTDDAAQTAQVVEEISEPTAF
jgi:CBS domain-containing protein